MKTKTQFGEILYKKDDKFGKQIALAVKKAEKKYHNFFHAKSIPFKVILTYSNKEYDAKAGLKNVKTWRGAYLVKNKIVMLSPAVKKPEYDIHSYFDHEINHMFYISLVGSYHPVWFSEGMATYLMKTYKFDKKRFKKYFKSIKKPENYLYYRYLKKKYYKNGSIFYPLSYLVYEFLHEKYGQKKILCLLREFSKKKSKKQFNKLFVNTFNSSIKQTVQKAIS